MELRTELGGEDIMTTFRTCKDVISGKIEASEASLYFAKKFIENVSLIMLMIKEIKKKEKLTDKQLNREIEKWSEDSRRVVKLLMRPEYNMTHLVVIAEMFKMSLHGTAFIGSLSKDKRIILYGREITGEEDEKDV